jgi:hypothetical protein
VRAARSPIAAYPLRLKHSGAFSGGYSNLFATVSRSAASNHQLLRNCIAVVWRSISGTRFSDKVREVMHRRQEPEFVGEAT